MKKVIDGKMYDTETAEKVASWDNGYSESDFHYCSYKLYRSKKGSWFLYGEGGAMSVYAATCGSNTHGGNGIEVLTSGEALEWLSKHGFADEAEQYFADKIVEA